MFGIGKKTIEKEIKKVTKGMSEFEKAIYMYQINMKRLDAINKEMEERTEKLYELNNEMIRYTEAYTKRTTGC